MTHTAEANRIRLAVSERGGLVVPYTVGSFRAMDNDRIVKVGVPGVSDLIGCIDGRAWFIEVKVGRDRQREEQARFQAAVERAGGRYVMGDLREVLRCLQDI